MLITASGPDSDCIQRFLTSSCSNGVLRRNVVRICRIRWSCMGSGRGPPRRCLQHSAHLMRNVSVSVNSLHDSKLSVIPAYSNISRTSRQGLLYVGSQTTVTRCFLEARLQRSARPTNHHTETHNLVLENAELPSYSPSEIFCLPFKCYITCMQTPPLNIPQSYMLVLFSSRKKAPAVPRFPQDNSAFLESNKNSREHGTKVRGSIGYCSPVRA